MWTEIKTKPPKVSSVSSTFNFEILKEMNFHCFYLFLRAFQTCWVYISELLGDTKKKMILMQIQCIFSFIVRKEKVLVFHRCRQCCVCRLNPRQSGPAVTLPTWQDRRNPRLNFGNIPGCLFLKCSEYLAVCLSHLLREVKLGILAGYCYVTI